MRIDKGNVQQGRKSGVSEAFWGFQCTGGGCMLRAIVGDSMRSIGVNGGAMG